MSDLDNLLKSGFTLHDNEKFYIPGLEIVSLKLALKSYYSTYNSMKDFFNLLETHKDKENEYEDYYYSNIYFELFTEIVIHFQHFFELSIKELLRSINELLVVNVQNKPLVNYKLINKQDISIEDYNGIQSIEFSQVLKNASVLSGIEGIQNRSELNIINQYYKVLEKLNTLRNRIIHRGSYVMRYDDLDEFIGKHILPLVEIFIQFSSIKDNQEKWSHRKLFCELNPLNEIVIEYKKETPNKNKIKFLKELGRAAYNNPIEDVAKGWADFYEYKNEHTKKSAVNLAAFEDKQVDTWGIKVCPVCGVHSLIQYKDYEPIYIDSEGNTDGCNVYTPEIKCMCCGFNTNNDIGNPKDYGYGIEDLLLYELIK